jgi:hypothetical protein
MPSDSSRKLAREWLLDELPEEYGEDEQVVLDLADLLDQHAERVRAEERARITNLLPASILYKLISNGDLDTRDLPPSPAEEPKAHGQ